MSNNWNASEKIFLSWFKRLLLERISYFMNKCVVENNGLNNSFRSKYEINTIKIPYLSNLALSKPNKSVNKYWEIIVEIERIAKQILIIKGKSGNSLKISVI